LPPYSEKKKKYFEKKMRYLADVKKHKRQAGPALQLTGGYPYSNNNINLLPRCPKEYQQSSPTNHDNHDKTVAR